jgi:hypothetical protein
MPNPKSIYDGVKSVSPLSVKNNNLSVQQFEDSYNILGEIINNLDDYALREISSGSEKDVDGIFSILLDEVTSVLTSSNKTINTTGYGYLEKFTHTVEETLRCYSLNYFITACLSDMILAPHNIEWGNLVQIYRLLNILAARDNGKTMQFSFAYPLWQMYRYRKWNPKDPFRSKELFYSGEGMIVTNEYKLGIEIMEKIRDEIESNDILTERLFKGKGDGWGKEKITCKNGARLYIRTANSSIRGLHPKWFVLDDYLNESSLYSQDQRDKYWNTFMGAILPALSPGGQGIVVGTPFFELDLYGMLKKAWKDAKSKGYSLKDQFWTFEFPAIYPDGTILFPQRHTYESIMAKKEMLGSLIFSREILVKPITDDSTIFTYEILNNAIVGQKDVDLITSRDATKNDYKFISVGCDFAISSSVGADYSVFTILGVDKNDKIHLLNCWRKKGMRYGQQIAVLKKINRDFKSDIFVLEINGMQEIFLQELQDAGLPAVGDFTGNEKKSFYDGVPSLSLLFENGLIKFPYGTERARAVTDIYFSELNSIAFIQDKGKLESTSQHDDTCMSLWQGVKGIRRSVKSFDFSFI